MLLLFIEISLLMLLCFLHGTRFLFSQRVGVSQDNPVLKQKQATVASKNPMLQKARRAVPEGSAVKAFLSFGKPRN